MSSKSTAQPERGWGEGEAGERKGGSQREGGREEGKESFSKTICNRVFVGNSAQNMPKMSQCTECSDGCWHTSATHASKGAFAGHTSNIQCHKALKQLLS